MTELVIILWLDGPENADRSLLGDSAVVLPHMINTHRRSLLLVILASVVLLLAGTGLFLISRPTARATTPPSIRPASRRQRSPPAPSESATVE